MDIWAIYLSTSHSMSNRNLKIYSFYIETKEVLFLAKFTTTSKGHNSYKKFNHFLHQCYLLESKIPLNIATTSKINIRITMTKTTSSAKTVITIARTSITTKWSIIRATTSTITFKKKIKWNEINILRSKKKKNQCNQLYCYNNMYCFSHFYCTDTKVHDFNIKNKQTNITDTKRG